MTEKFNGIVLRVTPYRENGAILSLLTDRFGRIGVMCHGARSARRSVLYAEPFVYSSFEADIGRGLATFKCADVIEPFYGLRSSLDALSLAQYFAELASVMPEGVPDPAALRLVLNSLSLLSRGKLTPDEIKLVFEVRFAVGQGIMPVLGECACCGKPAFRWVFDRGLLCDGCADGEGFSLTEHDLALMRFIASREGVDTYRFKAESDEVRYLSRLMRNYLSYQLDMRFSALDLYGKY